MAQYDEDFKVGTRVRTADLSFLEDFQRTWKYHHPLTAEQIQHADRSSVVARVGFYNCGDVLYELQDVPGIWHESCLKADD